MGGKLIYLFDIFFYWWFILGTMMKSNVITITITPKKKLEAEITSNKINSDKLGGYVGDTIHFTGEVTGYLPDERWYVLITIYINNKEVGAQKLHPPAGRFYQEYKFQLTFNEPGTYNVYTDATAEQYIRGRI